jgi:hypothetical protein
MTINPYAAPGSEGEPIGPPPPKSFAWRMSSILSAVGFVGFWGLGTPIALSTTLGEAADLLLGLVILMAFTVHLVGIGVVFAAPRGRRLLPALLNGAFLAIMIAVIALLNLAEPQ